VTSTLFAGLVGGVVAQDSFGMPFHLYDLNAGPPVKVHDASIVATAVPLHPLAPKKERLPEQVALRAHEHGAHFVSMLVPARCFDIPAGQLTSPSWTRHAANDVGTAHMRSLHWPPSRTHTRRGVEGAVAGSAEAADEHVPTTGAGLAVRVLCPRLPSRFLQAPPLASSAAPEFAQSGLFE